MTDGISLQGVIGCWLVLTSTDQRLVWPPPGYKYRCFGKVRVLNKTIFLSTLTVMPSLPLQNRFSPILAPRAHRSDPAPGGARSSGYGPTLVGQVSHSSPRTDSRLGMEQLSGQGLSFGSRRPSRSAASRRAFEEMQEWGSSRLPSLSPDREVRTLDRTRGYGTSMVDRQLVQEPDEDDGFTTVGRWRNRSQHSAEDQRTRSAVDSSPQHEQPEFGIDGQAEQWPDLPGVGAMAASPRASTSTPARWPQQQESGSASPPQYQQVQNFVAPEERADARKRISKHHAAPPHVTDGTAICALKESSEKRTMGPLVTFG